MARKTWAAMLSGVLLCTAPNYAQDRRPMRFQNMDRDRDGAITRDEWQGSDKSFQAHDWNRDGILSGAEVREGATRDPRAASEPDFDSADREYEFDDWTERGFRALDHNRDNRIVRDEWHFDREGFRRADHDGDGTITRAEFLNEDGDDDDRDDRVRDLDANGDGRISRAEWHGGAARFAFLDHDRDGFLTRTELLGDEPPTDLFASVDVNRDHAISRDEWHWSRASFDQRDRNHDGRLSPEEFGGSTPAPNASQAYQAGYERGLVEGRQAGREDRDNNAGWDLEGQRELEQADSGYNPVAGSRTEYQAGYRAAFRMAYRQGWERR